MYALVIEPSRSYRTILASVLTSYGYMPREVSGFNEALDIAKNQICQLICMSVVLEDGDCYELIAQIRASKINSSSPILLLTSNYSRDVIEKAYLLGVTEVFRKEDFSNFEIYLSQFSEQLKSDDIALTGKILYVEDHKSVATMTQALLESCGHEVEHFTNAESAWEAFSANEYDLVLTDVLLEGEQSGTSLVRHIRQHQHSEKRRIPVVAVSAFSDNARRIELFRAGINDYAQKPVLNDELLARVNNLIRTQKLLCELDSQQKRLAQIALVDHLTGLYNRHLLMETAPKQISRSRRQGYPLSLLIIDLDYFKQVNDRHGHDVGDKVLVGVASELKKQTRAEDILGRYGGEEFILLLENCDLEQAGSKAEKIRAAIERLEVAGLSLTTSIGVSCLRASDDFNRLFIRADEALYLAKAAGRNRVQNEMIN